MQRGKRTRLKQFVLAHFSEVKGSLLVATLCTLGLTLTDLLRPWPLKIIFDNILLGKPLPPYLSFLKGAFQGGKTVPLVVVSFTIILIALLKSVSSYSQLYITSRIGYRMAHRLRSELFIHLQRLSISFHKRLRSGELLTKITGDTNTLKDAFTDVSLTFVSELLTLVGMLVIMFLLDWRLSLIVFATFPVLVFISFYRYRKVKDSARRQRKAEGKIASRISEIFTSVPVVHAFSREKYEERRFEAESMRTVEESVRTARMEAAAARAVDIISAIGTWAVILFGSMRVLAGQMTPGNVLVFAAYMNSMYGPVRSLAKLSTKFSKAMVSAQRVGEILEVEPEVQDSPDAIKPERLTGRIVFEDVSFNYADGKDVLRKVSFTILPGQQVALLGHSGAGKTTLISLILRFFDPRSGSVSIDGGDVKKYQRESLRNEIGIILQDSILFGATIKENIAYGKLDATMDEIVAAAKAANAHDFILELENAYDTMIGERGGTLSGGQRQRIAIARTFIRNAPILIMDEPMTGLDIESEVAVRDAMKRLMAGKTCLVITHDYQTVVESDLLLVMDEGQIVAQGQHSELLARSEHYRRLFALQVVGNEEHAVAMGT